MPGPATMSKSISGFDPRSIPGCQLWLDAADASTLFSDSGGTVQASITNSIGFWKDKSANGFNYTQATSGSRPIYTSTGNIQFNYGHVLLNTNTWSGGAGWDIFCVSTPWSPTSTGTGGDWRTLFRGATAGHRVILYNTSTQFGYYANNGGGFFQFGSQTLPSGVKSLIYVSTNSSYVVSAGINGSPAILAGSVEDSDTQPFYALGAHQGGSQEWGVINEILIYSNVTTSQRHAIEGYLAKKWSLPLVGFNPSSIAAGLSLWLDASDTSTYTLRGTNLNSSWTDKSGTGNHALLATPGGSVYPSVTTMNGLPAFNFASNVGASTVGLMYTTNTVPISNVAFFIVAMFTGLPGYPGGYAMFMIDNYAGQRQTYVNSSLTYPCYVLSENYSTTYYYQKGLYVTNSNIPFLIEGVMGGVSANTFYVYGNGNASPANPQYNNSTGASQWFIGGGNGGLQPINACIGEIIMYSNATTSTFGDIQRKQVEAYLMQKWRINASASLVPANNAFSVSNATAQTFNQLGFPILNPFLNTQPFLRQFSPIDLPGCVLWLDAMDASTVSASGGVVTNVADKSPTGTVLTSPARFTWPNNTFNGSYPSFYNTNATGGRLGYNSSFTLGPNVSVFIVSHVTNPLAGNYFMDYTDGVGTSSRFFIFNSAQYASACLYALGSGGSGQVSGSSSVFGSPFIWSISYNTTTTASITTQSVNGTALTPGTIGAVIGSFTGITIGQRYNLTQESVIGHICEFIIYNTALTTVQYQQVEGYLAAKWGLLAKLPSTHPFSKIPPSSAIFLPSQIYGCSLWLDSADPNGVGTQPANGTGISTWIDKSGNGNHAVAYTSITSVATPTPPSVVTKSLNGLPGLLFSGSSGMRCLPFLTSPNSAVFYVVNFSGSGGQPFIVWKLKYSSYLAIKPGQLYVGVNNSGTYPTAGYDAQATYTNSYGTPYILGMTLSSSPASSSSYTFVGSINGTTTTTTGTSTSGNPSSCTDYVSIGCDSESGIAFYPMYGTLYEVIIYNQGLSSGQRQQIEGYLAWKWGLQGSLPTTHPYYKYAPCQPVNNLSITTSGLILNLDPQTYVSAASTWVPYVGNTWNVYNSPTVSQVNGYNVLTFNGTNQYCYDGTGVNFQGAFSINIWINLAAVSTAGNILQETNGGYQWTDLYITSSTLYVGTYQINNVSIGAPAQGAWYNICFTNSASGTSSLVCYVNGAYYSTTTYTRTSPGANSYFYITGSSGNANYGYKAFSLGVMCFYTVALSSQDVKQNYNALSWRYGLPYVN